MIKRIQKSKICSESWVTNHEVMRNSLIAHFQYI